MPLIQTNSTVDQQKHRFTGGLFNFFSDVHQPQLTANGGGSINNGGNTGDVSGNGRNPWLHMVKNQTGRVMQGGTDLVLTPINWFTNLTNNWYIKFLFIFYSSLYHCFSLFICRPLYLVCMTIIMCLVAFFYCTFKACIMKHLLLGRQSIPLPFTNFLKQ
jgi:hypothetical protein